MSGSSYRWIILGISFINITVAAAIRFSFSIFFVAILEEFKWSRASIAGAFSLSALLLGISSWFGGRLVDRFGTRKIMIGGIIILALSTIASGRIQQVWHLYALLGVLTAIGIAGLGRVPHSVLLSNWFVQRRGTVVGIAFSGLGVGVLVIGPISQILISSFGWRTAYMVLGLMILALLLPVNSMVRNRPNDEEDHSTRPSSNPHTEIHGEIRGLYGENGQGGDWTLGRSMRTLPFWALSLAFFLLPLGIFPVMIHQVAYIIDQGYSRILAASIFGAIGLLSTGGRLIFGPLSDRIGREKAVTWSFVCSITGVVILLLLPALKSVSWLYLYALVYGMGFGARGPIGAAMMADMYQGRHFGNIYGFIHIGNGIGGALGPLLGGYLYDVTGSYTISFLVCIPVLALACVFFWMAGWSRRRKTKGQ